MSRPENTPAPAAAQQLKTTKVDFANQCHGELLSVRAGVPAVEALQLARGLASGVQQILGHLSDAINHGETLYYMDEMLAIGFLSDTVASLVFSVERELEVRGGEQ